MMLPLHIFKYHVTGTKTKCCGHLDNNEFHEGIDNFCSVYLHTRGKADIHTAIRQGVAIFHFSLKINWCTMENFGRYEK